MDRLTHVRARTHTHTERERETHITYYAVRVLYYKTHILVIGVNAECVVYVHRTATSLAKRFAIMVNDSLPSERLLKGIAAKMMSTPCELL